MSDPDRVICGVQGCSSKGGANWVRWHQRFPHMRCLECGWVGTSFSQHASKHGGLPDFEVLAPVTGEER